jgi:hypothetical protein
MPDFLTDAPSGISRADHRIEFGFQTEQRDWPARVIDTAAWPMLFIAAQGQVCGTGSENRDQRSDARTADEDSGQFQR